MKGRERVRERKNGGWKIKANAPEDEQDEKCASREGNGEKIYIFIFHFFLFLNQPVLMKNVSKNVPL